LKQQYLVKLGEKLLIIKVIEAILQFFCEISSLERNKQSECIPTNGKFWLIRLMSELNKLKKFEGSDAKSEKKRGNKESSVNIPKNTCHFESDFFTCS
jgi:hypothetical protein